MNEVHMREMRNTYKILVGKPEQKRPTGKSTRRCEGTNRKTKWALSE
jgi:hypothetical protein